MKDGMEDGAQQASILKQKCYSQDLAWTGVGNKSKLHGWGPRLPYHIPCCTFSSYPCALGNPLWPNEGRGKKLGQIRWPADIIHLCWLRVDFCGIAASLRDGSGGWRGRDSLPAYTALRIHMAIHFLHWKVVKGLLVSGKWLGCMARVLQWRRLISETGSAGEGACGYIYGTFVFTKKHPSHRRS